MRTIRRLAAMSGDSEPSWTPPNPPRVEEEIEWHKRCAKWLERGYDLAKKLHAADPTITTANSTLALVRAFPECFPLTGERDAKEARLVATKIADSARASLPDAGRKETT